MLQTVLLELCNGFVARVAFFAHHELEKVAVPLPVGHWILIKKGSRADRAGVNLASISLLSLPKAILSSECGNATWSTEAGTCHDCESLAAQHVLSCLLRRQFEHSVGVTRSRLHALIHSILQLE